MDYFKGLGSYKNYLLKNPFHEHLNIDLETYGEIEKKATYSPFFAVNPDLDKPFDVELDDLIRLHFLIISRKVTTILEFGVGKSTTVFDHALRMNQELHGEFVLKSLRRSNPFECYSIDNNKEWIDLCKNSSNTEVVTFHYSECSVSSFNDRVCTYFDNFPNICPDLIYLDGPDQFSPLGDVRGVNTNHPDRVPMSGDILAIEHFLLPGTLIIVDGRTSNARFLESNFQRNWIHTHIEEYDQHFFELIEKPLGIYNKTQIDYCLGDKYYERLEMHGS